MRSSVGRQRRKRRVLNFQNGLVFGVSLNAVASSSVAAPIFKALVKILRPIQRIPNPPGSSAMKIFGGTLLLLLMADSFGGYWSATASSSPVIPLRSQKVYEGKGLGELDIFCYNGRRLTPFGLFSSSRLEFRLPPTSYDLYEGETEAVVKELHANGSRSWMPILLQRNYIPFAPFTDKCVGILSWHPYQFVFREYNIDYFRLLQCTVCLALFFYSRDLVHSPAIFYSSGAFLGVIASILLLFFLIQKMLPGGRLTVTALFVTGWSFWIYLLLQLWNSKVEIFNSYKNYFLAYIGLSAGVAFLICYRWGPPKDVRTIDTMQFLMQFLSLCGVYFSSDIPEITLAICMGAILLYNFPVKLKARAMTWFKRRFFKPKIRLLTEEEYIRQGDEVTARELEKLRQFARSPDCNAWKMMSKLKDPSRFGSFVMGDSHLQDAEILEYEIAEPNYDEDEEANLTHDESEDEVSPSTARRALTFSDRSQSLGPSTVERLTNGHTTR